MNIITPQRHEELVKQILASTIHSSTEVHDWELLGVKWNRNGDCYANVEHDARGNAFTTNFHLHRAPRIITDNRGRALAEQRERTHFACRNCGVMVEWRKNKAGKAYLAEPKRISGYHLCTSDARAWYELQKDAMARATEWCKQHNLEVTAETLAQAVNPQKAGV